MLIFSDPPIANTLSILAWLNIFALSYTVFSIYYQWRVAKQWCVFCLTVQALLVLGGINVLVNKVLFPLPNVIDFITLKTLLLYFLPVFIWYSMKPYLLQLQEAKNTKREFLRIKFNGEIFETLLKMQKKVSIPINDLGIDLGNPEAKHQLIKVCNPFCGPCAKVHPEIEKLLKENANIKVKIIFTTPNQPESLTYKVVAHLLAIADKKYKDGKKIEEALDNWYIPEEKDYELFASKYFINGELYTQGNKLEAMEKWCKKMEITHTPTIFVNGYQLPDAYRIKELQYFLLE